MNEIEIWARIDKSGGPDACWPWRGNKTQEGYGVVSLNGAGRTGAHRIAYQLDGNLLEKNDIACHKCDNRICCNPSHIFTGSPKDNVHDCMSKGRFVFGEKNGVAKLTENIIRAIRLDKRTQTVIAAHYAVSQSLISVIKRKERWYHVQD